MDNQNNVNQNGETKLNTFRRVAGKVGVAVLSLGIGYIIGGKCYERNITRAIEACWEADPTLKDHMWDAVVKVMRE